MGTSTCEFENLFYLKRGLSRLTLLRQFLSSVLHSLSYYQRMVRRPCTPTHLSWPVFSSLFLSLVVSNSSRRTITPNLHWSLRYRLAWICRRYPECETTWRQSVSSFVLLLPSRTKSMFLALLFADSISLIDRSFFQSLCVLGYCIFPLDLAALVSIFVKMLWIRLPICFATFGWSVWGELAFLFSHYLIA